VNGEVDGKRVQDLCDLGTKRLLEGRVSEAIDLYEQSIHIKPTAEGYTFRGWAVSFLGDLDSAIEDCKRAIRIDPDFGNPYNAIPWFQTAKNAKRYEPRHFPYLNLGRVYLAKGESMRALDEFVRALEIRPEDGSALEAIEKISYSVN